MVAFSDVAKKIRRKICVYGPAKIGKSLLVGKLAEAGYILDWIDAENGSSVLSQLSPEAQARINVIPLPDTKDYPIAIETCLKVTKFVISRPYKICWDHGKIDCPLCNKTPTAVWSEIDFSKYTDKHILVIDSLTQVSNSSMAQITKGKELEFKPGWDEFNAQGMHLSFMLGNIQNCAFNVAVVTHEIVTETTNLEKEKTEKLFPLGGTKNFSRTVAKYFDDVVHMDIFNRRHRGVSSTTATPEVLAGTRSDLKIENLTEPSLLPFFTGEMPSANDVAAKAAALLKPLGVKQP